jgi:C-terminal processing protease CtpA/Prc
MQGLGVNGTADWTQYSITLPWNNEARQLYFGFLLSGTGKAWVDDLQMFVDGAPVEQAPNRVLTPLDTDHEFDNGSGITLTSLSDTQINNLATLAKVWGFLKYHHPTVTGGQHQWDYDLFRILPQVLAAANSVTTNAVLTNWIASLGTVAACSPCATLDTSDLALSTNLDWISNASTLGSDLSQTLLTIYTNRTAAAQFYVSLVQGVGNPSFDHELAYPGLKIPDAGYQMLALFRFWNMVQYFYPNRTIMSDDVDRTRPRRHRQRQSDYWDQVLLDSIPAIALAGDSLTYQQKLMRFIGKIHDTHANLWTSLAARPPIGTCYLPVDVRFVEGQPIVLRYTSDTGGPASGLMPGDLIQQLDGIAVFDLVAQWTPLYADSNQAARLRDISEYMARGPCGPASVVVQRGDQTLTLTPSRLPPGTLDFSSTYKHDRPGDTFQMLTPEVAYLKLSSVVAANSQKYIQSAAGTKGLIIDIRNYPSEFVVFTLGSLLVSQPVNFVRFTQGDLSNPSAFHWTPPLRLIPQEPHYAGRVAILVDEVTQSQAEYTTMAFRTAPGAVVIGSTTAGADGNVSTVPLPGGLSSYISGIGVFYPDKTPTQRVGIIPDIVVAPTIAGIQAGRDELIEEALRQLN